MLTGLSTQTEAETAVASGAVLRLTGEPSAVRLLPALWDVTCCRSGGCDEYERTDVCTSAAAVHVHEDSLAHLSARSSWIKGHLRSP